MARTFGKLLCDVWDDPAQEDFLATSPAAKVLYWAWCSQRDITPAGVVPLTERRWRRWLNGDANAVETAFQELIEGGWIVVDEDTAEVWLRSFIVHDGRLENVNLAKSVHSAIPEIRSAAIREACYRLVGDPTAQNPSVNAVETPSEGPPDRPPDADGKGSRTPRASSQHQEPRPAASSREPRSTSHDDPTPSTTTLPAAAAAAIELLIEHRVANEAKRNPGGLRRSLQRALPDELRPALDAYLERQPEADATELARKVLGLSELDLHRIGAN